MLDKLFDKFDWDSNGAVDFSELSSRFSILCGGTQDDGVTTAFSLFDVDGDGYINRDEMELYLGSVYKILFNASSQTRKTLQITPEELAKVTTSEAFDQADRYEDGRRTFEESKTWYSSSTPAPPQAPTPLVDLKALKNSLGRVRRLTTLGNKVPSQVFEVVAARLNSDGVLDRPSFNESFCQVTGLDAKQFTADEQNEAKQIIEEMFDIFDFDGDGKIDFVELSSGLTVLCGGRREEKVASAFVLYDLNNDGYTSPQLYLVSVFRVLYGANPGLEDEVGKPHGGPGERRRRAVSITIMEKPHVDSSYCTLVIVTCRMGIMLAGKALV